MQCYKIVKSNFKIVYLRFQINNKIALLYLQYMERWNSKTLLGFCFSMIFNLAPPHFPWCVSSVQGQFQKWADWLMAMSELSAALLPPGVTVNEVSCLDNRPEVFSSRAEAMGWQTDRWTDRQGNQVRLTIVGGSVGVHSEALAQGRRNDCSLPVIKTKAKLIYQTSVLNIKCLFVQHMSDSGMLSGWLFFLLFSQMMALDPKQDTRLTSNRPVATVPFQNCLNERLNFIFGLEVAEVEQPLTEVPN